MCQNSINKASWKCLHLIGWLSVLTWWQMTVFRCNSMWTPLCHSTSFLTLAQTKPWDRRKQSLLILCNLDVCVHMSFGIILTTDWTELHHSGVTHVMTLMKHKMMWKTHASHNLSAAATEKKKKNLLQHARLKIKSQTNMQQQQQRIDRNHVSFVRLHGKSFLILKFSQCKHVRGLSLSQFLLRILSWLMVEPHFDCLVRTVCRAWQFEILEFLLICVAFDLGTPFWFFSGQHESFQQHSRVLISATHFVKKKKVSGWCSFWLDCHFVVRQSSNSALWTHHQIFCHLMWICCNDR